MPDCCFVCVKALHQYFTIHFPFVPPGTPRPIVSQMVTQAGPPRKTFSIFSFANYADDGFLVNSRSRYVTIEIVIILIYSVLPFAFRFFL